MKEYKVEVLNTDSRATVELSLNRLASDYWELITVSEGLYYFARDRINVTRTTSSSNS